MALEERLTQSIEALDKRQTLAESMNAMDERQTRATQELGHQLTRAIEPLTQEISRRDAHQTENMELSNRLDVSMDIRERLAQVEARLPKQ